MTKLLTATAIALLSVGVFAQDSTKSSFSEGQIKERIEHARYEMTEKMEDELVGLSDDIKHSYRQAYDKADRLGKEIDAIKADSSDEEYTYTRIKELFETKRADAEARIKSALEKIDEYKNGHKDQFDAAHADMRERIEQKKADLEEKRAEIEAKIASKRAEIEAALAKDVEE